MLVHTRTHTYSRLISDSEPVEASEYLGDIGPQALAVHGYIHTRAHTGTHVL
jgi:hypothetical protein